MIIPQGEKDNPDLVLKVHTLLAESKPAVLAYAAQLGDKHIIKEYLKNFPNEVFIVHVTKDFCMTQFFSKPNILYAINFHQYSKLGHHIFYVVINVCKSNDLLVYCK